jgi:hypothetical protein
MRDNIWVLWHVLAALAVAGAVVILSRRAPACGCTATRLPLASIVLATLCSLALFARVARNNWRVTQLNRQLPSFVELGALLRSQLPAEAVLLLENLEKCEHVMLMFHADRSVYPVTPDTGPAAAEKIAAAGGIPLLVTHRSLSLPLVFDQPADGRLVYAMPPFTRLPAAPPSPTTQP